MKTPKNERDWARVRVTRCLGEVGPHLLRVSNAADGPNPYDAIAHLLGARAAITDAINNLEHFRDLQVLDRRSRTRRSRRAA